jgi:phosphatidylglycerol---prolipoprotein diacylglyceryl transferase
MRQTLLYLPERLGGYPLWGFGWGFAALVILVTVLVLRGAWQDQLGKTIRDWGLTWGLAAFLLLVALPALEKMPAVMASDDLPNHGVPIRGYGVMLAVAVGSGLWLAAARSRLRGIHPDVIYPLAVWVILGGIAGARLLFVIQNLSDYRDGTVLQILFQLVNIAGGGLVVYGALLGAGVAFFLFTWRHKLPRLALADVVAPSLILGLAIGRIGCFLNGCCWGGISNIPWAVSFPKDSPPYLSHLHRGLIQVANLQSLPVHPTQLYDSISGFLILGVLLAWEPLAKRPGEMTGLLLLLYSSSRFVIEWIRDDELGFLGTYLTVSQYLSIGFALLGLALIGNFLQRTNVQQKAS